jgi:cellulose biosynthesis protein BcsQ
LWTGIDNLDLLPGDSSMRGLDGYFAGLGRKKRVSKIAKGLSKNYARIIIDCPPGLSETSDQIIQSADLIIVPVIPSPLSSRALKDVQAHLLERHGGHVPILPVYSMVDRRRTMHRDALVANPKWPVIPMASVVERMGSEGAPVGAYAPSAPVTQAFSALWKGVERKIAKL